MAEARPGVIRLTTDEERDAWVRRVINDNRESDGVWVFGYGSLIWNPAFHFAERLKCEVEGYHRSFCMWTKLGRGSEEFPGLMLGLETGGSTNGVVYRVAPEQAEMELDILFRRELMSNTYNPTWVTAECEGRTISAITFVMDPEHERYYDGACGDTMVRHLADAVGPLGRNCDYLFQLVEHLSELDYDDPSLRELAAQVRAYQAKEPSRDQSGD